MAFPVSIVVESRPLRHRQWSVTSWRAVAAIAGENLAVGRLQSTLLRDEGTTRRFLWGGLEVRLDPGAAESYWHNLMSDHPVLCVICQADENGAPTPVTVTADHELASAHMEGDDTVFAVPMPAEIHQWLERFVVDHFRPAPRKQRKRQRWTNETQDDRPRPVARRLDG